ncbi:hypothetical protein QN277_006419 [Acacia crassicarpa]|uniref:Uncharacterized protein n=1 Tax=Acacia crassicarpa TaxID=499986 RepID=A0AAE1M7T0_9FABA|nr:hypothetical protein QN277_006419 [Acacia crassicarpa]
MKDVDISCRRISSLCRFMETS